MRFIIEATVPVDTGNQVIIDGSLMGKIQNYLNEIKPEAAYFTIKNGQRTMIVVVNMEREDKMPALLEPLWLDLNVSVQMFPAMVAADLQNAGPDFEKVVSKRK